MGELDELDFGADTDAIRRWLAKRATYADDIGDPVRGGKHRVDPPGTVDPRRLTVPSSRDAGQHVLDALVEPAPPIATRWPASYKPAAKSSATEPEAAQTEEAKALPDSPARPGMRAGRPRSPYASTPEHEEELKTSRSTNQVFKPRRGVQTTMTLLLLACLAVTGAAAYLAYDEKTNASYGALAICALVTLLIWAVRASTSVTEMAVIRGQLEMIRNGKFEVIDLASPYTPVLVEGTPGKRGWKVLIERHDEPLLVLDASMVDPAQVHRRAACGSGPTSGQQAATPAP